MLNHADKSWTHRGLVFVQDLIVLGHGHAENDRRYIFKAVNPLLPFWSLTAHIKQSAAKLQACQRKPSEERLRLRVASWHGWLHCALHCEEYSTIINRHDAVWSATFNRCFERARLLHLQGLRVISQARPHLEACSSEDGADMIGRNASLLTGLHGCIPSRPKLFITTGSTE